jgi:hypothetical protein
VLLKQGESIGRGVTQFWGRPMKATALPTTSRVSTASTNLAIVLIFCLLGLVLTFSIIDHPDMQSPEIDMVSP